MAATKKASAKVTRNLPPRKTENVKGGDKPGRLATNHNLTLVRLG